MFLRLGRITDLTHPQMEVMARGLADGTSFESAHFSSADCLGYAAGADREDGKVCVVSLWPTRDAMIDSRLAADRARAARTEGVDAETLVDEYEVAVERTVGRGWAEPGDCIRLSRVAGLVEERIPDMVERFRDHAEVLAGVDGFAGLMVGVERNRGRVTAISRWRTRADLEATEALAARAREARMDSVKPARSPQVDRYDVIAFKLALQPSVA